MWTTNSPLSPVKPFFLSLSLVIFFFFLFISTGINLAEGIHFSNFTGTEPTKYMETQSHLLSYDDGGVTVESDLEEAGDSDVTAVFDPDGETTLAPGEVTTAKADAESEFVLPESDAFEPFGRWYNSILLSLIVDMANPDERMESFRANGRALVLSGLTVHSIKWLTNKKRPVDRGDERWNSSFPSGHSAIAFCQAGALGELHSGLRGPLLLLACLVGRSRIKSGHHRFGDVLVGGAIGYLWGRYEGRKEEDKNNSEKTATISLVNLSF